MNKNSDFRAQYFNIKRGKYKKNTLFAPDLLQISEKSCIFAADLINTGMEIIGRTEEMAQLKRYAASIQPEFVAMYGRRRVGKTFLINKTLGEQMVFETSGVLMGEKDDQFEAFNQSLRRIGYKGKTPRKWMDMFFALEQTLTPNLDPNKRQIIFIDELPCFDVKGTRFVAALGHFWNSWVSKHDNLMLIVCGSATSWMVDNIVNNHGGLHDRITHLMHLHPFTLAQTEQYMQARQFKWDRLAILQAYMVFGGIPYYLSLIEPKESVAGAIDRLLFSKKGELRTEYERLFVSLFTNPAPYIAIVQVLAKHRYGLTRIEIADVLKKSNGGNLSEQLDNLVKCDFVSYYRTKTKKINKNGGIYMLADHFTQFFHSFVDGETDELFWTHNLRSPKVNTYFGLSFERVCMAHIPQIKKALGIDQIGTEYYSWRSNDPNQRAQVDLIIERADRLINLCEIKYSATTYTIDKSEDLKLRIRQAAFVDQTETRYGIMPTFITTYGLTPNGYASNILNSVVIDDLFIKE